MVRHPMEWTIVYRLWQAPFAERKLRPVLDALAGTPTRRVLDVGCGPGTNARHFADTEYLGVDINPSYIEAATRRFGKRFQVADASDLSGKLEHGVWDCILVNSLIHHLSDDQADALLSALPHFLAPGGQVHILDLVLPPGPGVPRMLALADRGRYPRPAKAWQELFSRHMQVDTFDAYPLGILGVELWSMVYCRASRRGE